MFGLFYAFRNRIRLITIWTIEILNGWVFSSKHINNKYTFPIQSTGCNHSWITKRRKISIHFDLKNKKSIEIHKGSDFRAGVQFARWDRRGVGNHHWWTRQIVHFQRHKHYLWMWILLRLANRQQALSQIPQHWSVFH